MKTKKSEKDDEDEDEEMKAINPVDEYNLVERKKYRIDQMDLVTRGKMEIMKQ